MRQGVLNSYRASVVFWLMVLLVVGVFATDYLISPRPATAADEAAPAENRAMSSPLGSAVSASSTTMSVPFHGRVVPAEREDAKYRISLTGKLRSSSSRRMTLPT